MYNWRRSDNSIFEKLLKWLALFGYPRLGVEIPLAMIVFSFLEIAGN